MESTKLIDVRLIPPPERHPLLFQTFDELDAGTDFTLVNDHDPVPLHGQFDRLREGQFSWEYLERGPDLFRVLISKVG